NRREPDSVGPERAVSELDWQDDLQRLVDVDRAKLAERAALEQRRQILLAGKELILEIAEAVGDGDVGGVDERRLRDVAAEDGRRFQDRADAFVLAQCDARILVAADRLASALVDDAAEQFAVLAAVFEADAREISQVLNAERGHRQRNQRRDTGGLLR